MDATWIQFANFALNLLIIPLVKLLFDIRNGLTRLESIVESHQARIERLERQQDRP